MLRAKPETMTRSSSIIILLSLFGNLPIPPVRTVIAADTGLERRFDQTVRPFLAKYCAGCHGTSTPAAQFDIRPYTSMAAVVDDFGHWMLVNERLAAGTMPPKVAPQPPAEARKQMVEWIQAVRLDEAQKHAGDPGPVLARRLSNAEYNNSIRDLTG